MKAYWEKLFKILEDQPGTERNKKLVNLMTELEIEYQISAICDDNFNSIDDRIMDLYFTINSLRDTELRLSNEKEMTEFLNKLEANKRIAEDEIIEYLIRDMIIDPLTEDQLQEIHNNCIDLANDLNKTCISLQEVKEYMESQRSNYTLGKREESFYDYINNDIKYELENCL